MQKRVVMELHPRLAPIKAAVFPLVKKDGMPEVAQKIYRDLKEAGMPTYSTIDKAAVGRRYRRQDEIGTPFCITVDGDTAKDGTVTIRDRDTLVQDRMPTKTSSTKSAAGYAADVRCVCSRHTPCAVLLELRRTWLILGCSARDGGRLRSRRHTECARLSSEGSVPQRLVKGDRPGRPKLSWRRRLALSQGTSRLAAFWPIWLNPRRNERDRGSAMKIIRGKRALITGAASGIGAKSRCTSRSKARTSICSTSTSTTWRSSPTMHAFAASKPSPCVAI